MVKEIIGTLAGSRTRSIGIELRSRCGCRQTLALSRIGEGDRWLRVLNCWAGNSDGYAG